MEHFEIEIEFKLAFLFQIVEQGKPSDLLKDKDGIFTSMLAAGRTHHH